MLDRSYRAARARITALASGLGDHELRTPVPAAEITRTPNSVIVCGTAKSENRTRN